MELSNPFNSQILDSFQNAAQSLKLYRRAELFDNLSNDALIEELYVDPLPEEHIFKTLLKAHTTFLIGRKGTGKSTLFQRLQSELRKGRNQTSAYIDIKTVYESSLVDNALLDRLSLLNSGLPRESFEKLLLYKQFIFEVISEIKSEIQKRIDSSFREKLKEKFTGTKADLFEGLDNLLEDINKDRFISALGIYTQVVVQKDGSSTSTSETQAAKLNIVPAPYKLDSFSTGVEAFLVFTRVGLKYWA